MERSFESLPRRIFIDSCTAQILGDYGEYVYDGETIQATDSIHSIKDGIASLMSLRNICLVNERAMFEWIVSRNSMQEAYDRGDAEHLRWLHDIANHSQICLNDAGPTSESATLAARIADNQFSYLSGKDQTLLRDAILLRCDAFLTVDFRLARNASHICRKLDVEILTPVAYWQILEPWVHLWR